MSYTYFAKDDPLICASTLLERSKTFYNKMQANSYLDKLQELYRAYHGMYTDSGYQNHEVSFTGEQGELVTLPVNHYRNIGEHIFTMITANRPSMDARPVNTDYKSQAQTYLANGILEYYMREKGLEDAIFEATKMAIVLGSGYVKMEWNATAGEEFDIDEDTEEFIHSGDAEFTVCSPLDVVFDGTKESWKENEWVLVRSYKNKANLIAKYPEQAEIIGSLATKSDENRFSQTFWSNDQTDDIPVYEFFHKRTEALPQGRYMLFLGSDIILLDTDLPYRRLPLMRITPSTFLGTVYGYTPMLDILPIQQCINSIYSAIMTNQNAFGVHNVFVPRNANINVNNLSGGLNVIEGDAKPEVLELLQTPAEMFKFMEMLIQSAETISGVNSVARGNPEASLRSGSALALVQSMAIQFISGFQKSYVKLIEDCGTTLIDILKDFANTPRLVAIVGKNNKPLLKEFTGEQISNVSRVIVDVGNPLARTISGRVQMADQMLQMKMFKTPQQYFQVLTTGKLETMFEGDMQELFLIKRENEFLMEGKPVLAQIYDAHRTHIMEHKSIAADPDVRNNPELMAALNTHIQEHFDMLRTVDPDVLGLIGEQPLQPVQQPTSESMQNNPMADMMTPESGLPQAGDAQPNPSQQLPNIPTPPEPFSDMPVLPEDM